jgi:hypothetical protein
MRATLIIALSALSLLAQAPAKDAKPAPKPAAPMAAKAAPAKTAPAAAIIGNKDSKIYHQADCKMGAKIKPENKVTFASKAEAEKAGYKACKTCSK